MNNETYVKETTVRIAEIKELNRQCQTVATGVIGETLLRDDLFFCASLDRCVQLSKGFIELLKQRNLSCVGAILRALMDNCMRTHAAYIAKDKNEVIDCIICGRRFRDQQDKQGKKMTDAHLKDMINEIDPSFSDIYNRASGYVHFSNNALYQTVICIDDEIIEWQIGAPLQERFNTALLDAADAFIRFLKLNYKLIQPVVESKKRYDDKAR